MKVRPTTRDEILAAIESSADPKADAFAKTFVGKADKQEMWHLARGAYSDDGELCGAIITTVSKGSPKSANLQLMHTFAKHRCKGVGKALVGDAFAIARESGCKYFRVSAERTAVGFYQKCDIPFLGLQKSGTYLALFNLEGPREILDDFITDKALKRNGKIFAERCENLNEKDKTVIEKLGPMYLYDKLREWQKSSTSSVKQS